MSLLSQLRNYELRMREEGQKAAEAGAESGGELPFMYALQNVRYEIRLHADGRFRDVQLLSSNKSKGRDLGKLLPAPSVVRAAGVKAKLLMDNAEYALGIARREGDKNTVTRREAFRSLVRAAAEKTQLEELRAIDRFLADLDPQAFRTEHLPADFAPDMNVMFSIDGKNPLTFPAVQQFWAEQFSGAEAAPDSIQAECLITGEFGPVMRTEPVKIKGILGGQVAGMNIVSANARAFESYGLEQSNIAPIKLEAAEQYANGLNRLLAEPETRMRLGGVTYAFWTSEGAIPLVGPLLEHDPPKLGFGKKRERKVRPQEVRETLWSLFSGKQPDIKRGAAFFMVGITPSGSRVAVRSHLTSTVQDMVDHLADFFAAQNLAPINPEGSKYPDPETYDVRTLVSGLYRDMSKEHPEPAVDALMQFALRGQPLPLSFLPKLAARNRAEQRVTRPRAVLTKMVVLSNDFKELDMDKETLDALNPDQKEPAYHLGRLLAVLDDIQGNVMKANTTLVDRFYGAMSTTPYAVVGRLIGGSQAHLQKLRKEKGWLYKIKQEELEDVMSRLKDIPAKPLTTAQQALFALGYYHQRAHISEGKREGLSAKASRDETLNQPTLLNAQGDDKQ